MEEGREAKLGDKFLTSTTLSIFTASPLPPFPFFPVHKNNIVFIEQLWENSGNYEEADRKMSSIILPPRGGRY